MTEFLRPPMDAELFPPGTFYAQDDVPGFRATNPGLEFPESRVIAEENGFTLATFRRRYRLTRPDGNSARLSNPEGNILFLLMANPGTVMNKDRLYEMVYGLTPEDNEANIKKIKARMYSLRAKVERDPSNPEWIHTVFGSGYYWGKKVEDIPMDQEIETKKTNNEELLTVGGFTLDGSRLKVKTPEGNFSLTPSEHRLLKCLMEHPGVVDHTSLMHHLWPESPYFPPILKPILATHICSLRKKIEPDRKKPKYIKTHIRKGYSLDIPKNDQNT